KWYIVREALRAFTARSFRCSQTALGADVEVGVGLAVLDAPAAVHLLELVLVAAQERQADHRVLEFKDGAVRRGEGALLVAADGGETDEVTQIGVRAAAVEEVLRALEDFLAAGGLAANVLQDAVGREHVRVALDAALVEGEGVLREQVHDLDAVLRREGGCQVRPRFRVREDQPVSSCLRCTSRSSTSSASTWVVL